MKSKSITFDITTSFLLIILSLAVVMAFTSYMITLDITQKNAVDYTNQLINKLNDDLERYVSHMENICDFVNANPDVRQYITSPGFSSEREKQALEKEVMYQLDGILEVRKDIGSIVVCKNDGSCIINQNLKINPNVDVTKAGWYRAALTADGHTVISTSHVQNIIKGSYRWVISMSRAVLDDSGAPAGVLLVDLKYDTIIDLCKNITLGSSGYVFILDSQGGIVYHPIQQLLYSNIKTEAIGEILSRGGDSFILSDQGTGKTYAVLQSKKTNWKIAGVYSPKELIPSRASIGVAYLGIGGLFAVLAFLFAAAISRRLTKPIKHLAAGMRRAEQGDFDIYVDVQSENEIARLANIFNMMLVKIKELLDQNKTEMNLKRKSELKALQAQINPHFLYNTLDSIVWMAESGKSKEVVEMTMALATLFRTSISKGEEIIPIATEITNIRSYLTIQKMRYKDLLRYEINIPEDIMYYKIIKLVLQPLVENAIYHGIKRNKEGGSIIISGFDAGSDIILSVKDDGPGMDKEQLERILQQTSNSGVGVSNVNERLKLYYGEEYGLNYSSETGKGTSVIILIPKTE